MAKLTPFNRNLLKAESSEVWTEQDISNYRKCIHAQQHADNALQLILSLNTGIERPITKQQSDKGLAWLRNAIWTANGKPRRTTLSNCFGYREAAIILDFSHFTFLGVKYWQNGIGRFNTSPIYRVYAKNGSYFDYTVNHTGLPQIIT